VASIFFNRRTGRTEPTEAGPDRTEAVTRQSVPSFFLPLPRDPFIPHSGTSSLAMMRVPHLVLFI